MKKVFAPGCALTIYKPEVAERLYGLLNEKLGPVARLDTCCTRFPALEAESLLIDVCPGCDRRYRNHYPDIQTISLWELLLEQNLITLPDYQGERMTILDPCPARNRPRILDAVRELAGRMNIVLIEPEKNREKGTCCGDSFYGKLPVERVNERMVKRAGEMPVDNVITYCVSCIKSMHIGGKSPRYLVDLLFGETTEPRTFETNAWHRELEAYIENHS